jgi:hypothetical protein
MIYVTSRHQLTNEQIIYSVVVRGIKKIEDTGKFFMSKITQYEQLLLMRRAKLLATNLLDTRTHL